MAFVERRVSPRLLFNTEVECRFFPFLPSQGSFKAHSVEISAKGIRLVTFDHFNIGCMVELTFFLKGQSTPICSTGKVAWTEEFAVGAHGLRRAFEAGIEFISIAKEDKERIEQYVLSGLK